MGNEPKIDTGPVSNTECIADEDLIDTLIAISVMAKRLADRLRENGHCLHTLQE